MPLAVSGLLFSCSPSEDNVQPEEKPETYIRLSSYEENVGPEGDDITIYWSVTNPVEGAVMEISSNVSDWITFINTDVEGTVTFTVLQNDSNDSRSGEVVFRYADVADTVTVTQDGHDNLMLEDIIGVWTVLGDRWDLDNGTSICYMMDDESADGYAHDEDGNYITITVREFCEQYAEDYNADPANGTEGRPEDFADKLYEDLGLAGTIVVDEENIMFEWGLSLGFSVIMVNGSYDYNMRGGYMTVADMAIESDPRNLQIDVFKDEDGRMCFRYPEYYIVSMYNYDQTEEYWIYAPTIFYCEPFSEEND